MVLHANNSTEVRVEDCIRKFQRQASNHDQDLQSRRIQKRLDTLRVAYNMQHSTNFGTAHICHMY